MQASNKYSHKIFIQSFILTVILFLIHFNAMSQSKWRFAVLGDTHVGSSDTVGEMIPFLLADSIECVLVCGDLAEGGLACSAAELEAQLTWWQSIFAPLYDAGIGVYPVNGNHEDDAHNNISVWNTVFSGAFSLPQNGPSGEQNLTYSFTHKNALFIGLDNYVNIHTVNQNWLDQQLDANTLPHVFVFGHEAAFKVFHGDCLDDSVTNRNAFWQRLTEENVRAYFCGHDHFVDVAKVDDGDGNANNDIYQYLVGTGGGWLMSQYSNYNGTNTPYIPKRIFHDMEFGYALVEVSGESYNDCEVTITWKKRMWNLLTQSNTYEATSNIIQYSACSPTGINTGPAKTFSVYPNPANGSITVSGISGFSKIFDGTGREMWSGEVDELKNIDISSYKNGLYFIRNTTSVHQFMVVTNN